MILMPPSRTEGEGCGSCGLERLRHGTGRVGLPLPGNGMRPSMRMSVGRWPTARSSLETGESDKATAGRQRSRRGASHSIHAGRGDIGDALPRELYRLNRVQGTGHSGLSGTGRGSRRALIARLTSHLVPKLSRGKRANRVKRVPEYPPAHDFCLTDGRNPRSCREIKTLPLAADDPTALRFRRSVRDT